MLNKDSIKTLVANSLYSFHNEILKDEFATKKYVDDKMSNIPDAYTLLYPKEVDGTTAYYDIYDLPLGDYRIAQQNNIKTWNICVYVNNIRTQILSTANCRGFSFTIRSNSKFTSNKKPGRMILIDVFSITTGGEIFTFAAYDDGNVEMRKHTATILSANTETEFIPTNPYHPSTKKYVDDKVAGIVNSAPETLDTLQELATALGNDANFATTVATQIGKKVDKVDGMSLTHNDLTNELKANYDAAYAYSQAKHSYNDLTDKPTMPSIDGLATKNNPVFTGSISLGRLDGSKVGKGSVAMGSNAVASGLYSHAEGSSRANGQYSHAEGYLCYADGDYSHAEGNGTTAQGQNQHVEGKYNIEDTANKYAHIVGNGVSSNMTSNAHTLDWNGNAWFAGKVTQEGTPTDDKDLVNKKYVDDRLNNLKIKTITQSEYDSLSNKDPNTLYLITD